MPTGSQLYLTLLALATPAFAQPDPPPHNYAQQIMDRNAHAPESDRSWPLYAQVFAISEPDWDRARALKDSAPGHRSWPDAEALLDRSTETLELAERIASKRILGPVYSAGPDDPWAQILGADQPAMTENPILVDLNLRHLGGARHLSFLLRLRALAAAEGGRLDDAITDIDRIYSIAEQLDNPRMLICYLVRVVIGKLAIQMSQFLVTHHANELSSDQLATLADHATRAECAPFRFSAAADEELLLLDIVQRIYVSEDPHAYVTERGAEILNRLGSPDSAEQDAKGFRVSPEACVIRKECIGLWEDIRERLREETSLPIWQWPEPPTESYVERRQDEYSRWFRLNPTLILAPAYSKAPVVPEQVRMHRDALRTSVALHLYQRQHGAWPSGLGDLVPEFLPAVPLDWADGEPLRYRLSDSGDPLLYALGPDRNDDNGADAGPERERYFFPSQRSGNGQAIPDGDWVLWP